MLALTQPTSDPFFEQCPEKYHIGLPNQLLCLAALATAAESQKKKSQPIAARIES